MYWFAKRSIVFPLFWLTIASMNSPIFAQRDEATSGTEALDNGLAAIAGPRGDEDHDRLHRSFHGAHLLAESGAGYEAARVLAALAVRAANTDPGREAHRVLASWGLTVDDIRTGKPGDINASIARHIRKDHRGESQGAHVQNLINLRLYAAAAATIRNSVDTSDRRAVERQFGEIFERHRVPFDVLRGDADGKSLTAALQNGHRSIVLRREVQMLRMSDQEAAELGHHLLRRLNPRRERREEHDNEFSRWVEGDRHREDDKEEREKEPTISELVHHVIHRADRISERNTVAATVLARLVIEAAPKSDAANDAKELLDKLRRRQAATVRPNKQITDERPAENDPGAELFEAKPKVVRSYQLELSDDAIELLHDEPKHYVRGTFREDDVVYKDVGVRLKGSWGSFRMIDGENKAGFTIKFNEFVEGQRFHGLRRIVLNNSVQDPTFMHEYIGYGLFRDAGIPAPRVAFANLDVNNEPYGLYVQIEAVTKDFLKRWFSDTSGNLYEGPGDVLDWRELDLDTNQQKARRNDLRLLVKSIETADDEDPWTALSERIDADQFAKFLALEQIVGHWDGYTQTNNYRMYNDPTRDKFVFFPHGADQIFEEFEGNIFRNQGGILGRALLQTESGRERYLRALYHLLDDVWNEEQLRNRIAEIYQLIRPHVVRRTGKQPHNPREFEHSINRMLRFVAFRRYAVLNRLRAAETGGSWRERREHHDGLPSIMYQSRNW